MGRDGPAPVDKGGLVYLCFFLFGAGLLAPWNAFITAVDYFNYLWPGGQMDRKFSVVYLPVMLVTLLVMLIWHNERTATARVVFGFTTYTVIMALMATPLLSMSSNGGSVLSQSVPLGASALIGVVDGMAEPAVVGQAGYLPEVYMQGFLFGTASSGTIIALLRITTKVSFGEDSEGLRNSTILYFSLSSGLCAVCLIMYHIVLPKQPFFRHYRDRASDEASCSLPDDVTQQLLPRIESTESGCLEGCPKETPDGSEPGTHNRWMDSKVLGALGKMWRTAVGVFLVMATTLTIFPGVPASDVHWRKLGEWYNIMLITTFDIGDLTGKALPLWAPTIRSQTHTLLWCVLRCLFVPIFFAAVHLFPNPLLMAGLTLALGVSNGFLHANMYMLAPQAVEADELDIVGGILVFHELLGLTVGAVLSWLWLWLE